MLDFFTHLQDKMKAERPFEALAAQPYIDWIRDYLRLKNPPAYTLPHNGVTIVLQDNTHLALLPAEDVSNTASAYVHVVGRPPAQDISDNRFISFGGQ